MLPSEITDYGYKNIFSFREEKFLGTYGLEYVYHHMYPQIVETQGAYTIHTDPDSRLYRIHEGALFINGKYFFSPRLSAEAGLRYSGTAQFGKFNSIPTDKEKLSTLKLMEKENSSSSTEVSNRELPFISYHEATNGSH